MNERERLVLELYYRSTMSVEELVHLSGLTATHILTLTRYNTPSRTPHTPEIQPPRLTGRSSYTYISTTGYAFIPRPSWFTGGRGNSVAEHHVVYCRKAGLAEVPTGFHIHHVDHDRTNNHVDNLVMLTQSAHMKHHANNRD